MKRFNAELAAPRTLGGLLYRRDETVHVVAAIAVVAEQQLVVVLRGAAEGATLTLDALPGVLADGHQHVVRELQTRWVT